MDIASLIYVFVGIGNTFLITCFALKTCSRTERGLFEGNVHYFVKYFCCDNHEPSGHYCKECEVGFTSINGEKCKTCKDGYFGRRCAYTCHCTKNQICEHVHGCVETSTNVTNDEHFWTTDENSTVSYLTTTDLLQKPNGSHASFNINVIIYCLCVICTMILMTICNLCVRRLRQKASYKVHRNFGRQSVTDTTIQNNRIELVEDNWVQTVHHEYDEIDETAMAKDEILKKTRPSTNEDVSSYEEVIISSGGYLNPYQPIVEYTDAHKYTTFTNTANKKKGSNSLPSSLECLNTIQGHYNCCERIQVRNGISPILHIDQLHESKCIQHNKANRLCNFKHKGRWSL